MYFPVDFYLLGYEGHNRTIQAYHCFILEMYVVKSKFIYFMSLNYTDNLLLLCQL